MTRRRIMRITLPDKTLERIDHVASRRGISREEFIREAVMLEIAELEREAFAETGGNVFCHINDP